MKDILSHLSLRQEYLAVRRSFSSNEDFTNLFARLRDFNFENQTTKLTMKPAKNKNNTKKC